MVIRLGLPEVPLPPKNPIAFPCRVQFDTVHDNLARTTLHLTGIQGSYPIFLRSENPVEMARHDHIGINVVAFSSKVVNRISNIRGQTMIFKMPHPGLMVKPSVKTTKDELVFLNLPFCFSYVLRTWSFFQRTTILCQFKKS